ncbi:hypothetical protein PGTUg99_020256 [Puccinia graminis f. sp. tritici]|uniref:Isochorismatase-like domain-containing protein n=1 Tax=Puccinia graminis f. sp. tritici TaxID=56615 RepID=A0A5B0RDK3_PUCGR|nr:hypothetical protein PGTUg99_020256 [Puccinia graminis f. sp. tritici]
MNQQQPLKLINAIILLCDMQERFRTKIFHFEHVEKMAEKMLKASDKLGLPILSTEQNPKALGGTVQGLNELLPPERKPLPKSQFSMLVPELRADIASLEPRKHVAILGIEAHICVLQTSLDLLRQGFHVHVLADAVSSCNPEERAFAFQVNKSNTSSHQKKREVPHIISPRDVFFFVQSIRGAGGTITTTESFLYRVLADANHPQAKDIFAIVKEYSTATRDALGALCAT